MEAVVRAALYLGLAFSLSSAAPAEPRLPTGKWVVNFADAQCVASRQYGTAEKPLSLVFKAPAAGDVVQVAIIREGDAGKYAEQIDGSIRFGDRPEIKKSALLFSTDSGNRRIVLFNLPRGEVAGWVGNHPLDVRATGRPNQTVMSASWLQKRGGRWAAGHLDEILMVTDVAALMKVMDECVADLRAYWNYTEMAGPSPLKERAGANLVKLFSSYDYPHVALASGEEGVVSVVVLVDEQGKVADCTLVQTSGAAVLDAQVCAVISERARYRPAIGMDGKPARDVHHARIRWALR